MARYFVYIPGKEKFGKTVEAPTSFEARKIVAAVTPGVDVGKIVAVSEASPSYAALPPYRSNR